MRRIALPSRLRAALRQHLACMWRLGHARACPWVGAGLRVFVCSTLHGHVVCCMYPRQGGGNLLESNLIFNMVRETADHGAFNRQTPLVLRPVVAQCRRIRRMSGCFAVSHYGNAPLQLGSPAVPCHSKRSRHASPHPQIGSAERCLAPLPADPALLAPPVRVRAVVLQTIALAPLLCCARLAKRQTRLVGFAGRYVPQVNEIRYNFFINDYNPQARCPAPPFSTRC